MLKEEKFYDTDGQTIERLLDVCFPLESKLIQEIKTLFFTNDVPLLRLQYIASCIVFSSDQEANFPLHGRLADAVQSLSRGEMIRILQSLGGCSSVEVADRWYETLLANSQAGAKIRDYARYRVVTGSIDNKEWTHKNPRPFQGSQKKDTQVCIITCLAMVHPIFRDGLHGSKRDMKKLDKLVVKKHNLLTHSFRQKGGGHTLCAVCNSRGRGENPLFAENKDKVHHRCRQMYRDGERWEEPDVAHPKAKEIAKIDRKIDKIIKNMKTREEVLDLSPASSVTTPPSPPESVLPIPPRPTASLAIPSELSTSLSTPPGASASPLTQSIPISAPLQSSQSSASSSTPPQASQSSTSTSRTSTTCESKYADIQPTSADRERVDEFQKQLEEEYLRRFHLEKSSPTHPRKLKHALGVTRGVPEKIQLSIPIHLPAVIGTYSDVSEL
jgi:hypothetical protein